MVYWEFLPDARLRQLVRASWQISEDHRVGLVEHRSMPNGS